MSVATEFADLLPDVVSWESASTVDGYGKVTFGAAVSIASRVTYRARMLRNAAGEEKLSGAQVWLDAVYGVRVEDRITLPDGSTPAILFVERMTALLPHEKVFLA